MKRSVSVDENEHTWRVATTCMSRASILYSWRRHDQLARPRVYATAGKLKAQCLNISESTVVTLDGSTMPR